MIFDTTTCTTYTAISDTFIKYHTTSDQSCTTTDYGTHCDCDNNQDHTIKHLNYDISMMILHDQDDDSNYDYDIYDSLYDANTVQQDDFVGDNNQYYLNNNNCDPVSNNDNANSIQDIVDTIIDVKMNGMFYIPAKKKYILYLLIPKKKRSFHTSKKKIDISNYLDNTVPSQSQSLFNIYLIDNSCDHVRVRVHVRVHVSSFVHQSLLPL